MERQTGRQTDRRLEGKKQNINIILKQPNRDTDRQKGRETEGRKIDRHS